MPNIKLKYAVVLLDYKGNSERMIKKKKRQLWTRLSPSEVWEVDVLCTCVCVVCVGGRGGGHFKKQKIYYFSPINSLEVQENIQQPNLSHWNRSLFQVFIQCRHILRLVGGEYL